MIRNDRQLAIAKKKLAQIEEAARLASGTDHEVWSDLAKDLRCEIDEFAAIKRGLVKNFELSSIDDLTDAIIKARIAQGITQAELASRLGVSEQMVQKDEAGGYENARVARLADVCDALGYELTGVLRPAGQVPVLIHTVEGSVPSESSKTGQWQVDPSPHVRVLSPALLVTANSGNAIILKGALDQ